jgi:prevent-host-death family protein
MSVAQGATLDVVARQVSVRELRNRTAEVVAAVRAGEAVALTVNRVPVADIVPHLERRSPWLPSTELRRVVADTPADPGLVGDLASVRGSLVDGP